MNASKRVQRPSWMMERHSTFKKKSKKVRLSMWEHEFICLARCGETSPPSPMEKADLIRAGLGPRKLSLFEFGDSSQFHDDVIAAFPALAEGGGYELMRTKQNNSRELCVIPPLSGGYTAEYLKAIVGQAKLYIRPIQKDLCMTPISDSDTSVSRTMPFVYILLLSYTVTGTSSIRDVHKLWSDCTHVKKTIPERNTIQ